MAKDNTVNMEETMVGMMMIIVMAAVIQQLTAAPPTPPAPSVYTCPVCGAEFATQAELDAHIAAEHPSSTLYTCPICGEKFTTQAELDAHVAAEHPTLEPSVEIVKGYIRMEYPGVSEAYSGWVSFSPVGSELNLALFGGRVQAGVLLRNPTLSSLKYTCTMYNYHWIEPNNYVIESLILPSVEPVKFPPAPTGLPYSDYEYECDKFLLPGGELAPGETGFIYTDLFYQSRRWNYVYIQISVGETDLGTTLLYSGWYSY